MLKVNLKRVKFKGKDFIRILVFIRDKNYDIFNFAVK